MTESRFIGVDLPTREEHVACAPPPASQANQEQPMTEMVCDIDPNLTYRSEPIGDDSEFARDTRRHFAQLVIEPGAPDLSVADRLYLARELARFVIDGTTPKMHYRIPGAEGVPA